MRQLAHYSVGELKSLPSNKLEALLGQAPRSEIEELTKQARAENERLLRNLGELALALRASARDLVFDVGCAAIGILVAGLVDIVGAILVAPPIVRSGIRQIRFTWSEQRAIKAHIQNERLCLALEREVERRTN